MAQKQGNTMWYIAIVVAFVGGWLLSQQGGDTSSVVDDTMTKGDDVMMEGDSDAMGTKPAGDAMADDSMEDDNMVGGDAMVGESDQQTGPMIEDPSGFSLNGYALRRGGVHLSWVLPENRSKPDRYVIVRSAEPNPAHDGTNYWWRVDGSVTEVDWSDVPDGTWNFRICALEGEECAQYSNNIELEAYKQDE